MSTQVRSEGILKARETGVWLEHIVEPRLTEASSCSPHTFDTMCTLGCRSNLSYKSGVIMPPDDIGFYWIEIYNVY